MKIRNSFAILCSSLFCISFALSGCNSKKSGGNNSGDVPDGYYLVTFDTKGGSKVDSQTVKSGEKATKPATDPTSEGNKFLGWFCDFEAVTPFDFNRAITSATTIYAGWEIDRESFYPGGGTSDGGSDPVTLKDYYLKTGVWNADGAWFAAYTWKGTSTGIWTQMSKVGSSEYYTVSINTTKYDKVIFVRMDPAKTIADKWDGKWNQTNDLSLGNQNCYQITGWGGEKSDGSWTTYSAQEEMKV